MAVIIPIIVNDISRCSCSILDVLDGTSAFTKIDLSRLSTQRLTSVHNEKKLKRQYLQLRQSHPGPRSGYAECATVPQ